MIQYYQKIGERIQRLEKREAGCWINLCPTYSPNELNRISEELGIPHDFLTDSLDVDERSRYEKEEEGRLILLNTPILNEKDKDNEAYYVDLQRTA